MTLFAFHAGMHALIALHPALDGQYIAFSVAAIRQADYFRLDEIALRRLPRADGHAVDARGAPEPLSRSKHVGVGNVMVMSREGLPTTSASPGGASGSCRRRASARG